MSRTFRLYNSDMFKIEIQRRGSNLRYWEELTVVKGRFHKIQEFNCNKEVLQFFIL